MLNLRAMKLIAAVLLLGLVSGNVIEAAAVDPTLVRAADLKIGAGEKRLEREETVSADSKSTKEKWCYEITLELLGFKPAEGIEVQYRMFVQDETPGLVANKKVRKEGKHEIAVLKPREKVSFQTVTTNIETYKLSGYTYYTNGARAASADKLHGIWVRVIQKGQTVAEFCRPISLKTKEKW